MSFTEHILQSNVLNVGLIVVLLGFLAKKFKLFDGIEAQRRKITEEIEAVSAQKQTAMAELTEVKRRAARLDHEVEAILEQARQSAESMSHQILVEAKAEAERLVENAKHRVALEQQAAAKDLEARLLSDALQDARSELASSLTLDDQRRSVEAFLAELPQLKGANKLR